MTPDVRPQAEAAAADRIPPAADQSGDLVPTLHLRIQPSHGWVPLNLGELWEYRELLYFLVWRDVKVRYKQTALGAAWAIIQPVLTMVVFSLFFGRPGQASRRRRAVPALHLRRARAVDASSPTA